MRISLAGDVPETGRAKGSEGQMCATTTSGGGNAHGALPARDGRIAALEIKAAKVRLRSPKRVKSGGDEETRWGRGLGGGRVSRGGPRTDRDLSCGALVSGPMEPVQEPVLRG